MLEVHRNNKVGQKNTSNYSLVDLVWHQPKVALARMSGGNGFPLIGWSSLPTDLGDIVITITVLFYTSWDFSSFIDQSICPNTKIWARVLFTL